MVEEAEKDDQDGYAYCCLYQMYYVSLNPGCVPRMNDKKRMTYINSNINKIERARIRHSSFSVSRSQLRTQLKHIRSVDLEVSASGTEHAHDEIENMQ